MALYITHQDPQIVGSGCVYGVIHRVSDMAVWRSSDNTWVTISSATDVTPYANVCSKYGTAGAYALDVPTAAATVNTIVFFYLAANCNSKNANLDPLVGSDDYGPTASINVGQNDIDAIACGVLRYTLADALAASSDTLDKHCLGSLVLLVSNATSMMSDSGSAIYTKHPVTDAIINSYTIEVGCGQPIRSIT